MGVFRNILGVSFCTFLSRISGLLRDVLIFSELGTGELNSAFLLAFTVPNLFRRLLGEGALNSALIPIFSDEYNSNGKEQAFVLLNKVLSRLICVLVGIIFIGFVFLLCGITYERMPERWRLCFVLGTILLPYMFFICLAAVFSAVLNIFGKFLLAASSPILLNISMVLAVIIGGYWDKAICVYGLCLGVLVGGVLQMTLLWRGLNQYGWRFRFDREGGGRIGDFQRLFFSGVIGAATIQINIAVSRLLAYFVSSSAVSVLYLANRLVELPMGTLVIAVMTVIFPRLSNFEARGEKMLLKAEFGRGIFMILVIILPSMVGLLSLDRTILDLLFHWGRFGAQDIDLVLPVLRISIFSLPFYALSTHFVRGYHSKKDAKRPMIFSFINCATNIIFTVSLMFYFGVVGIAFANLLSVILQTILLYLGLWRHYEEFQIPILTVKFFKVLATSLLMGVSIIFFDRILAVYFQGKVHNIMSLCINIPLGIMIYLGILYLLMGQKHLNELKPFIKRLFGKFKKS
ncbi:MAG: murein biosynthesis integral membrane protein MurJ [Puniceicoccales bacterium]|jgi:putative peptidoglycan lipid II flippase|nr:murein biosynthesis integral membrane protein MurJ [Puniceicoccales bacterium]